MELLDTFMIHYASQPKYIKLYRGNLAEIPSQEKVDILVISAYKGDYTPFEETLIKDLDDKGLSVETLAKDKYIDLTESFSCWLSRPIPASLNSLHFKRILCFERKPTENSPDLLISGIFRSLMPFIFPDPTSEPVQFRSIAMPLVATGSQKIPLSTIFEPLIDSAIKSLLIDSPLDTIKIVTRDDHRVNEMIRLFDDLKPRYAKHSYIQNPEPQFDFFISYRRQDEKSIDFLVQCLKLTKPTVKIFLDKIDIKPGDAWRSVIIDSLKNSRYVVPLITKSYFESEACNEEISIAINIRENSNKEVIIPLIAGTKPEDLPKELRSTQGINCDLGDVVTLAAAAKQLIKKID